MTQWFLSASVLILIVLALRAVLRGKMAPWLQYALWGLVLVRLLVPFELGQSRVSVANVLPQPVVAETVGWDQRVPPMADVLSEIESNSPAVGAAISRPSNTSVSDSLRADPIRPYSENLSSIAKGVWLTGTALVLLALLCSNLSFYRKLRRSRKRLDLDFPLPVYGVEGLPSPCLFGLVCPSVYIPYNYVNNRQTMEHMLAHEYAHFRQGDHLWSLLRGVAVSLHWFNPLVWLAAVLSKADGELSCDARAIGTLGEDQRLDYGRTLLTLITAKPRPGDLLSCATTMTSGKKTLQNRVKAIAKKPKMLAVTAICVLLVAVIAVGCTFTGPKAEEAEEVPDIAPIEADQANLRLYAGQEQTDAFQFGYTGDIAEELLDLYNSQQITETGKPVGVSGRLDVEFVKGGKVVTTWTVTPEVCSAKGVGNYFWDNSGYDRVWDLYWETILPDSGKISNPLSSLYPPDLSPEDARQVLDLFKSMELEATSNELDFVHMYEVTLKHIDQNVLHFLIDPKGEVALNWLNAPQYYMAKNGEDVYKQLEAILTGAQRDMQTIDDFYVAITYDREHGVLCLPEGDYDGWSFTLSGRMHMDEGEYMSYHQAFTYEDSLLDDGSHGWKIDVTQYSDLLMMVTLPGKSGSSLAYDLRSVTNQPPTTLIELLNDTTYLSCVVEGDMAYEGVPLSPALVEESRDLLSQYDWGVYSDTTSDIAASRGPGGYELRLYDPQNSDVFAKFYSHGDLVSVTEGVRTTYYRALPNGGSSIGEEFRKLFRQENGEICGYPPAPSEIPESGGASIQEAFFRESAWKQTCDNI